MIHDIVHGEAEMLEVFLGRGTGAEAVDGDRGAMVGDILAPSERRSRFHGDARRHLRRQDVVAIILLLLIEQLP